MSDQPRYIAFANTVRAAMQKNKLHASEVARRIWQRELDAAPRRRRPRHRDRPVDRQIVDREAQTTETAPPA